MGRRSSFTRKKNDDYPTIDPRAVTPLFDHLPANARYVEPCAGAGNLIRLIGSHAACVCASDIVPLAPGIEVRDVFEASIGDADFFVTNSPWSRPILHRLIIHLSNQAPTWLLFDSAWANTKQATKFMSRLRRVVAVGRLIWIEGTKTSAKEDCSWYLFSTPSTAPTEFYGRGVGPPKTYPGTRICFSCRRQIGQRDKWKLIDRGGIATCVHRHCDNPESYTPKGQELLPAPLLDLLNERRAVAA